MLGLCWKPAAIQGMQKVARTMPSNPEQLLGAILVRRDIFQRFESTMQDTCLDANNLLEYLFSLYNSTAAPAERENFQSNQNIRPQAASFNNNATRRDSTGPNNKKSPGQSAMRQMTPKTPGQGQAGHHQGIPEIQVTDSQHRKRAKLEQQQNMAMSGHNNIGHHTPGGFQQHQLQQSFDTTPVFPGSNNIKMELGPDSESRHQQSSSPLPPFSQIRRQGRPFSPGSAQTMVQGSPLDTPAAKNNKPLKDNNSDFPRRKKPKRHQCFCGALFTRADNLKRHIRKCHEEKLEKLANAPLTNAITSEVEQQQQLQQQQAGNVTNNQFDDFQQLYPASAADMHQNPGSQEMQQHQQQQMQHPDQDQRQQQQQQDEQQQQHTLADVDLSMSKAGAAPGVKWSCFCGESFEDHRLLVEHTRIHEGSA